jgi:hypothetical protein
MTEETAVTGSRSGGDSWQLEILGRELGPGASIQFAILF